MTAEFSLSTQYFSKEFSPDWEIEWKANLITEYPLGFINKIIDNSENGGLAPFYVSKNMGNMPVCLKYQNLWFHYYAHQENLGWIRDVVLIQPPNTPILIPQFKENVADHINACQHNVVIRKEKKGGLSQAFPLKKLDSFLSKFQSGHRHETEHIGTVDRERYSIFLTNSITGRNYSVVADLNFEQSKGRSKLLSQVEVEYKGRSGISAQTILSQKEILLEFDLLADKIQGAFGTNVIKPTTETKMDWLIKVLGL